MIGTWLIAFSGSFAGTSFALALALWRRQTSVQVELIPDEEEEVGFSRRELAKEHSFRSL